MYCRTPFHVSSLKQFSVIFLHYWEAPLPCCCTPDSRHRSCFEHGRVLLNVESCHPLYNRTVDFVFFQCKDPKTISNGRIWISLRMYTHLAWNTEQSSTIRTLSDHSCVRFLTLEGYSSRTKQRRNTKLSTRSAKGQH